MPPSNLELGPKLLIILLCSLYESNCYQFLFEQSRHPPGLLREPQQLALVDPDRALDPLHLRAVQHSE